MIKVIRKCFFKLCCVLCNIYIEENYEKIFLLGLKYYIMIMEEYVLEFVKYCKIIKII